jgi:hypothetical protein
MSRRKLSGAYCVQDVGRRRAGVPVSDGSGSNQASAHHERSVLSSDRGLCRRGARRREAATRRDIPTEPATNLPPPVVRHRRDACAQAEPSLSSRPRLARRRHRRRPNQCARRRRRRRPPPHLTRPLTRRSASSHAAAGQTAGRRDDGTAPAPPISKWPQLSCVKPPPPLAWRLSKPDYVKTGRSACW